MQDLTCTLHGTATEPWRTTWTAEASGPCSGSFLDGRPIYGSCHWNARYVTELVVRDECVVNGRSSGGLSTLSTVPQPSVEGRRYTFQGVAAGT